MTLVLYFYTIYDETTSTAHEGHLPDPYKFQLSYQTYHFEIVSFSTLERSLIISLTTGIFTRVDYLRIDKFNHRNFRILQLIPWLFILGCFFIII